MASSNPNGLFPHSISSFDHLLAQSLVNRLHLGPSFTNSLDLLLKSPLSSFSDGDDDEEELPVSDEEGRHRKVLAREEAKLEREIIRIVHYGDADKALKPNSGQSVAIGEHNICVGVHEEAGSGHRVWEWHGHIMLFDEESGYDAEYIYGNYFERVTERKSGRKDEEDEEEDEGKKDKVEVGSLGLRDLIQDGNGSAGAGARRVLHRNSLNAGSASR